MHVQIFRLKSVSGAALREEFASFVQQRTFIRIQNAEFLLQGQVAFRWYVLYVALHEVYNFTSGLLLKYIYKISRV